jgi:hypothetical protein
VPELRHLTWPLLAASLVVGLAALVRIADPAAGGPDEITGVIRLPWLVIWTIITLFSLAALVLLLDLARRMRSRRHGDEDDVTLGRETPRRQPWLQALAQVLSLVNFAVIAYLLWKNVLPLTGLGELGQGVGSATALARERPVDAPFFLTWTFAVLALVAGSGALALALWLTSCDRFAWWWEEPADDEAPPAPLLEAVDESLEDLRAEPDARRAIIRCYARFERAAADAGLARRPWQTPMEFMRETLSRLPAPRGAVRALTGLFELARFSDRALGPGERDHALDALDDVKAAIEAERRDAVAH